MIKKETKGLCVKAASFPLVVGLGLGLLEQEEGVEHYGSEAFLFVGA